MSRADVVLSYFDEEYIEMEVHYPPPEQGQLKVALPRVHFTLKSSAQITLSCAALQATIRIGRTGFMVVPWSKEERTCES